MGYIHKFLNLQLIPSCFHVVSHLNHPSRPPRLPPVSTSSSPTIKLVTSDGHVKTYNRPIPVSNLTSEFPKHLVCRSDAFYIGRKIPALSEHDLLEPGHNYFLLPTHFFQSVLTFVTVASFVAARQNRPGSPRKKKAAAAAAAACRPFEVLRTPSGCLRIHVSDEFISQLMEEEEEDEDEKGQRTRLCSTPELEKDYVRLVEGSRSGRWKPKLETITESRRERKKRKKRHDFQCTNSAVAVTASTPKCSASKCKIIKSRSRK